MEEECHRCTKEVSCQQLHENSTLNRLWFPKIKDTSDVQAPVEESGGEGGKGARPRLQEPQHLRHQGVQHLQHQGAQHLQCQGVDHLQHQGALRLPPLSSRVSVTFLSQLIWIFVNKLQYKRCQCFDSLHLLSSPKLFLPNMVPQPGLLNESMALSVLVCLRLPFCLVLSFSQRILLLGFVQGKWAHIKL